MYRPPAVGMRPSAVALLLVLAFGIGVAVDRSGLLPGSPTYPPVNVGNDFDTFWQTWKLVDKYYVDRKAVDPQRMTRGAIQGLLASLGDVGHTTYLTHDELQKELKRLEGKLEGIGATLSMRNRQPTIVATLPGSPASKALKPGDIILAVDGKPVTDLPLNQIVLQVRGQPGSTVHLSILRTGKSGPLKVSIKRAKIVVPLVTWHRLPGVPIAHVAIRDFGKNADEQLRKALSQARQAGAEGLIIDLRGDPGGFKDQAVAVTSEFLTGGNVFVEKNAEGQETAVPVKPGGTAADIPICVLIDEGTASSAEILAGAIQDYQRGKLVGTKTFGTGTVLRPFPLTDGSAVFLAVTEWLTPKGRQIWHKGITPDYVVPLRANAQMLFPETEEGLDAAGLAKSTDTQLLKALQVLKKQMGINNKKEVAGKKG